MSENSKIEWTDHTFNPWIGCTKVSPGCANCYADAQDQFRKWTPQGWGKGKPRKLTSEANWREPLKWNANANICGACGESYPQQVECMCNGQRNVTRRARVFCASLADWLDDEVATEWRVNLLETIHATPDLDWLLLSKRPENWQSLVDAAFQFAMRHGDENNDRHCKVCDWLGGWSNCHLAPSNVWVGTTVEDQARAEERIPWIQEIPAKVRFLSCEPLLGSVNLTSIRPINRNAPCVTNALTGETFWPDNDMDKGARIDWVICGGESGPNARPMHPAWARSLRDQCAAAGVPFLFKQWGEWAPDIAKVGGDLGGDMRRGVVRHLYFGREPDGCFRKGDVHMRRVGKKAAGRILNGKEHNEFPV